MVPEDNASGAAQAGRSRRLKDEHAAGRQPAAARRTQAPLVVELLDAAALEHLDAREWDELAADAIEDNPFYARQHVLAGLATIDAAAGLQALAIRRRSDGRLLGLFPFQEQRFPAARAAGTANLYQMSGTPLVRRAHAAAVIEAWLQALAHEIVRPLWSLPNIDLRGRFIGTCAPLAEAAGLRLLPVNHYRRPQLQRLPGGFEAHLETAISKSRIKDIQRNLRRLRKLGEVRFEHAVAPAAVAQRIEDFLRIEHAGWKGAAGTSFLSQPLHAAFARRAYAGAGGLASANTLWLDDRPIAINVNIRAGGTVFTPKSAFDETYRKCSPGLILEYLVTEAFYREARCTDMDAATTVDGHMVQELWNAEKPMATLILGPDDWRTAALARWHRRTAELKSGARRLLAPTALAPALSLLRSIRRRLQSMHGDLLLTFMCATHTLEGLVKAGL